MKLPQEGVKWLWIFFGGLKDPLEDLMKAISLVPRIMHIQAGPAPQGMPESLGAGEGVL